MLKNLFMTKFFITRDVKIIYDPDKNIYIFNIENHRLKEKHIKNGLYDIFEKKKITKNNFKKYINRIFNFSFKIIDGEFVFDNEKESLLYPLKCSDKIIPIYIAGENETFRNIFYKRKEIIFNFNKILYDIHLKKELDSFICKLFGYNIIMHRDFISFNLDYNLPSLTNSPDYTYFIKKMDEEGFQIYRDILKNNVVYDKTNKKNLTHIVGYFNF